MKRNLNELDMTRIVRRVLNEEDDMFDGDPKKDCFTDVKIRVPSCRPKTTGGMIGTGVKVSQACIRDLGNMLTMNNLIEVTKVLGCIAKQSVASLR